MILLGGVKLKVVRQEGIKDCGVCSLLSVLRHYGGDASLEYLRELTSTTKNGVSAYHLVQAANTLGFYSYGIHSNFDDLNIDVFPIISHVIVNKSYQHFIVIYSINKIKKELLIMDPAVGRRKVSFAEFKLMTSNYYVYLKPIRKILKLERKNIVNDWLINFFKNHKKYIPYIILLTGIYFFTNIISMFYFKLLLNKAIDYSIVDNVYFISGFILVLYFFKEVTFYLKNVTLLKWSELLDEELTKNVFKRLILLPYLYYHNRTTGEVLSRIKDLSTIKNFLAKFFSVFIIDFVLVLIFIFMIFSIHIKLALIVLVFSFLLFILTIIMEKLILSKRSNYLNCEDKINSLLFEIMSSMSTIKALHIEKYKTNIFYRDYQILLDKGYLVNRLFLMNQSFNQFIYSSFQVFFLTIGSILIIKEELKLGSFIVFQTILNYYFSTYQELLALYQEYHNYQLAVLRINDLFTIRTENFHCLEYFQDYNLCGTIKIKNLSYSYGCEMIFKNLDLVIHKKDKVFLTGESGIGKSTLMKILNRYLNIPTGCISINNMDLNHYHLDVIRRRMTYISQQESLFTGTLRENIIFQKEEDEKLLEVSKIVLLEDLLDKDLGFSKLVEEGGVNFSGGERQRIILARSLMKDSDIYIFDEALNQIDIDKEELILKNIFKYLKDKIVIVISHRLTCKKLFNRVLVLKDGKICEEV